MNVALKSCMQQEYQPQILKAAPCPLQGSYRDHRTKHSHQQADLPTATAFENLEPLTHFNCISVKPELSTLLKHINMNHL